MHFGAGTALMSLNEITTEKRLTLLEERQSRMTADLSAATASMARVPQMEAKILSLWEQFPRLQKSMDALDADARRLILGMAMAGLALGGQFLAAKLGL